LEVALELAKAAWKVALTDGKRLNPSVFKVDAADLWARLEQLVQCLLETVSKWKLPKNTPIVVIHEAGQDGFWIARALQAKGITVHVVDAASIPVPRQAKRRKTDRLDALRLLEELGAWLRGERRDLRMLHIPTKQAEAQRLLTRERGLLQKEMTQHVDRARKLLALHGCTEEIDRHFVARLAAGEIRCADGTPLPDTLVQWLLREDERLKLARLQFAGVEKTLMHQLPEPMQRAIATLSQLGGVGWVGATRIVLELFWRDFTNRRQVGACLGLVPQPYDSGESRSDQGISKQGNRRVRALLIEMAWSWLRHQPQSELAQWFVKRTAGGGKRIRRIAVVAVARRLAIALWRLLKDGVLPQGAQLKAA
jgi:transposase